MLQVGVTGIEEEKKKLRKSFGLLSQCITSVSVFSLCLNFELLNKSIVWVSCIFFISVYFWLWRRVVSQVVTSTSEPAAWMFTSALKMAVIYSFEMFVMNCKAIRNLSQKTTCKIWGFHGGDYEECHLLTLVSRARIFLPWRWRRYVPPKRRFAQDLHGATSQKTAFFIVYRRCCAISACCESFFHKPNVNQIGWNSAVCLKLLMRNLSSPQSVAQETSWICRESKFTGVRRKCPYFLMWRRIT
jgi:hypothetical protein